MTAPDRLDVLAVLEELRWLAHANMTASDGEKFVEARDAIRELIEAAECPNANIIFREIGPGYVIVPADDWNRLRAALAALSGGE